MSQFKDLSMRFLLSALLMTVGLGLSGCVFVATEHQPPPPPPPLYGRPPPPPGYDYRPPPPPDDRGPPPPGAY